MRIVVGVEGEEQHKGTIDLLTALRFKEPQRVLSAATT